VAVPVAGASAPEIPADRWADRALPEPVAFEPFADLRAHACEASKWLWYEPPALDKVEVMGYPARTLRGNVLEQEVPLYERQATLGGVEIGYLTIAAGPDLPTSGEKMLAVRSAGVWTVTPLAHDPVAVLVQEGEVHVLSYSEEDSYIYVLGTESSFGVATFGTWNAVAVGTDGKVRDLKLQPVAPSWSSVESFNDKGGFGMRGEIAFWAIPDTKPGQRAEVRYRWDPAKKTYEGETKTLPPLPRPRARPKKKR
jgi:hypothetical protein